MTDAITDPLDARDLSQAAAHDIREHKWLFYISGVLSIVFGVLAITIPQAATLAANIVIGAVFAASGLIGCITAFQARKVSRIAAAFLLGLLGLAAGVLLLVFPIEGIVALTVFLAAYFIASGLLKGYFAFSMRPIGGWGWMLAGAIATLLLGILIWSGLPGSAAWVLGLLVGIDLIFYGTSLLAIVSAAKRLTERAESSAGNAEQAA